MTKQLNPITNTVRASVGEDKSHGSVMPPLFLSSNFTFERFDKKRKYDYTRSGNPTRDQLGDAIADLEGGFGATITASGMASITLALHTLEPNALVIVPHDCYGGTHRLLEALKLKGTIRVEYINQTDKKAVLEAFKLKPQAILIETPSNPLLRITDVEFVATEAKKVGALVFADNTFLSPALQNPISLGADLVLHSTTKYLNGHSDVVGGAIVAATQELHEKVAWWANCLGSTGAPFDAYLTLRGMRTLHTRIKQQELNTHDIVKTLATHELVSKVYYPGLEDHEGHDIAARQQKGYGAMVSFELKGDLEATKLFLQKLELFTLAESLGGVESLIAHPATMTHAAMTPEARVVAGIGESLLRVSVGLEASEDLCADIKEALDYISRPIQLVKSA